MGLKDWALGWTKYLGDEQITTDQPLESGTISLDEVEVAGDFEMLAKGTSFRQEDLEALGIGQHQFVLFPEPNNKHDPLAVAIRGVSGEQSMLIGYVSSGSQTQELAHEAGLLMYSASKALVVRGEIQEGDTGLIAQISMPGRDRFAELIDEYSAAKP